MDNAAHKLPANVQQLCLNPDNELLLSVVSVWEMQIKIQLGKLTLRTSLEKVIADQRAQNGVVVLPVYLSHVLVLQGLPAHHKDPFDRLLICQAQIEGVSLLSKDEIFFEYTVGVIWG